MAASDYEHGTMNVESQSDMYAGVMKAGLWGAIIILLGIAYSLFILSLGMNWLVALALCAGGGIVIGLVMNMGAAWIGTVIVLAAFAIFIQLLVFLGALLV